MYTLLSEKANTARKEMVDGLDEAAEVSACVCLYLDEGTEDIALLRRFAPLPHHPLPCVRER